MGASNFAGYLYAKGRPAALLRQDVKHARASLDEQESAKVRIRSQGRCEVWEQLELKRGAIAVRCKRRAVHVHHLLPGNGTRARGESAKSIRKLHTCTDCHSAIHNKVLVRISGGVPQWTDRYRRLK